MESILVPSYVSESEEILSYNIVRLGSQAIILRNLTFCDKTCSHKKAIKMYKEFKSLIEPCNNIRDHDFKERMFIQVARIQRDLELSILISNNTLDLERWAIEYLEDLDFSLKLRNKIYPDFYVHIVYNKTSCMKFSDIITSRLVDKNNELIKDELFKYFLIMKDYTFAKLILLLDECIEIIELVKTK
jgi:hypothetical protein